MTHCHSTDALACIEAAVEQGKSISAVVKETRPRQQGHITAEQLRDAGVPVTLIVDSAARRYLDEVDHVVVGADSIAADGGVINKIGTSGLAVNARERGVPIMTAAQTIKLHPETLTGHTVEIEMRDESEVIGSEAREEIGEIAVENPAFDDAAAAVHGCDCHRTRPVPAREHRGADAGAVRRGRRRAVGRTMSGRDGDGPGTDGDDRRSDGWEEELAEWDEEVSEWEAGEGTTRETRLSTATQTPTTLSTTIPIWNRSPPATFRRLSRPATSTGM